MMDILSYSPWPYNFWSGAYSSNELTTPKNAGTTPNLDSVQDPRPG